MWVTYYGKGYDIPMLQSRLLKHRLRPLEKRLHLDLYFSMNSRVLTSRKSQGHRLRWLGGNQQKMGISPEEWNLVLSSPERGLSVLGARCVSDVKGLEALYRRFRPLIINITK